MFIFENVYLKVEEYHILYSVRAVLEILKTSKAKYKFSSSVLKKMSFTEDTIDIKLLP
jgi:hypothetical protein